MACLLFQIQIRVPPDFGCRGNLSIIGQKTNAHEVFQPPRHKSETNATQIQVCKIQRGGGVGDIRKPQREQTNPACRKGTDCEHFTRYLPFSGHDATVVAQFLFAHSSLALTGSRASKSIKFLLKSPRRLTEKAARQARGPLLHLCPAQSGGLAWLGQRRKGGR